MSGRQIVYMKMTTNTFREEAWIYHTEVAENINTAFTSPFGQIPLAWEEAMQQSQSKGKGKGKGYSSNWPGEPRNGNGWQWG